GRHHARIRVYTRRHHCAQVKPDDQRADQQRRDGPRNPTLLVMNACSYFVSVHVSALARRRRGSMRLLQIPCALTTPHLNSPAADFDLNGIWIEISVASRTSVLSHKIVLLENIDLLEHPKSGCDR